MNTKKKPEPVQEKYQQTKANSKRKAKGSSSLTSGSNSFTSKSVSKRECLTNSCPSEQLHGDQASGGITLDLTPKDV